MVKQQAQKRPHQKDQILVRIIFVLLGVLTIYHIVVMDYGDNFIFWEAMTLFFKNMFALFLQPQLVHFKLDSIIWNTIDTIGLSLVATIFSMIISFVLAVAASENLSHKLISTPVKLFVAYLRAIPTILWVLIFSITIGLGPTAAVLGIVTHSIAYLVKAYSEIFEELHRDIIDALLATGARFWQIIFQAILPATLPQLLAWSFLRLEINFGVAVVVGAAAAAGGIGFELAVASGHYANIYEVGFIVWIILLVSTALEVISLRWIKKIKE